MRLRASAMSRWQRWLSLVLRVWFNATVWGAGLFVPGLPWDSVAQAGSVSYVYDDLGRLLAVVDGTAGQAAIYQYDAVGNLLGITNQAASVISILNFTPKSGPVGTTVTISGTGFSATVNQNIVKFNGTTATVTSATATQLVVTVPTGATTGPISVTVGSTSATTGTPFTMTTSGSAGVPTITSFTPTVGTAGTAVTITGTNFDPILANDKVGFNSRLATTNSVTPTSINTTVPTLTGSGRITVGTPFGQAISSSDFFIPPVPYTVADVAITGRMAIGESRVINLSTANKIAVLVFDGNAGQRVSALLTNSTFITCSNSATLSLFNPGGTKIGGFNTCSQNTAFLEPLTLPSNGTYTLMLDPDGTNTGQATITLYNVVDVTGSITPGGAGVAVTLGTPGQRALLTFSGSVNQKVSAWLNPTTFGGCGVGSASLKLLKPDGTTLAAIDTCGNNTTFLNTVTLPIAGTYTLLLDPASANTGSATLTLYTAVDVTGTLTVNGATVPVSITTPGQNGQYTFNGNANQQVTVRVTGNTIAFVKVSLLKPDGTVMTSTSTNTSSFTLAQQTLPATGAYTVGVDPSSSNTGTLNLQVTSP